MTPAMLLPVSERLRQEIARELADWSAEVADWRTLAGPPDRGRNGSGANLCKSTGASDA